MSNIHLFKLSVFCCCCCHSLNDVGNVCYYHAANNGSITMYSFQLFQLGDIDIMWLEIALKEKLTNATVTSSIFLAFTTFKGHSYVLVNGPCLAAAVNNLSVETCFELEWKPQQEHPQHVRRWHHSNSQATSMAFLSIHSRVCVCTSVWAYACPRVCAVLCMVRPFRRRKYTCLLLQTGGSSRPTVDKIKWTFFLFRHIQLLLLLCCTVSQ